MFGDEVASSVLHEPVSENSADRGDPSFTSCRAEWRTFCFCASASACVSVKLPCGRHASVTEFGEQARPLLHRPRCLSSRMGCNSMERVVMGDLYRYHE